MCPLFRGLARRSRDWGLLQVCNCTKILRAAYSQHVDCEERSDAPQGGFSCPCGAIHLLAIRSLFTGTLGRRKHLVMPPAGSFSKRGKGTKSRFFTSGLPSVGAGEGAAEFQTAAPHLCLYQIQCGRPPRSHARIPRQLRPRRCIIRPCGGSRNPDCTAPRAPTGNCQRS